MSDTPREWYAGMALQGLLASCADPDWSRDTVAAEAFAYADAMLAQSGEARAAAPDLLDACEEAAHQLGLGVASAHQLQEIREKLLAAARRARGR